MAVEITGLTDTLKLMRKFAPDVHKNMNAQIKGAMIPIRDKARAMVPSPQPTNLTSWNMNAKPGVISPRSSMFREISTKTTQRMFPLYNASEVERGIVYRQGASQANAKGFRALYYVANTTAAGQIYEIAGRRNPNGQPWNRKSGSHYYSHSNNPEAGAYFISHMGTPLYGKGRQRGRLLYKAWDQDHGKAYQSVLDAINAACLTFNQGDYMNQSSYTLAT